ncbi:MAG: hypothetical protein ACE5JI_01480 [Acidobacteriota bacterium]
MRDSLQGNSKPGVLERGRSRKLKRVLVGLLVPGLLLFVGEGLRNGDLRVWQIYLVNLLFWSGFSQAGVAISALLYVTNSKWGKNLRYVMEGLTLFSPVALVLFLVLFLGRSTIFPWVENPIPEKAIWLDITFLFVRESFLLLVLNILNLVFLYHSFRPEAGLLVQKHGSAAGKLVRMISSGWRDYGWEKRRSEHALKRLSPVILIMYTLIYSLVSFDFVMSLDPYWYSTLFGAYYFTTNLYMGLAGITVVSIVLSYVLKLERYIGPPHFHDLGKMIFAFCLIALDFFWSQYLVIWFGNIPEEITFLVVRINEPTWLPYTLAVLVSCFVLPFVVLLSRSLKTERGSLLPIACLVFVSVWLERYVLVVPSLWHGDGVPFGLQELAITVAFLSAFLLVYVAFMERFPILPSDAEPVGSSPELQNQSGL